MIAHVVNNMIKIRMAIAITLAIKITIPLTITIRISGGPSGLAVVRSAPRPSPVGLSARASALDPGIR